MMDEIIKVVGGAETLTITNIILAVCIIFHLICEFGHYIHEFISRKKDAKKLSHNNELLQSMLSRVEKIEKTQAKRAEQGCPFKEEKEHVG